jgi:protein transport protein SEC39
LTTLKTVFGGSESARSTKDTEKVSRNPGVGQGTIRKRDQLRNAAVGTLASGIGWLINAPPPTLSDGG